MLSVGWHWQLPATSFPQTAEDLRLERPKGEAEATFNLPLRRFNSFPGPFLAAAPLLAASFLLSTAASTWPCSRGPALSGKETFLAAATSAASWKSALISLETLLGVPVAAAVSSASLRLRLDAEAGASEDILITNNEHVVFFMYPSPAFSFVRAPTGLRTAPSVVASCSLTRSRPANKIRKAPNDSQSNRD